MAVVNGERREYVASWAVGVNTFRLVACWREADDEPSRFIVEVITLDDLGDQRWTRRLVATKHYETKTWELAMGLLKLAEISREEGVTP